MLLSAALEHDCHNWLFGAMLKRVVVGQRASVGHDSAGGAPHAVCLLSVPLRLLKASEDHFDDLFRELQMATMARRNPLMRAFGEAGSGWKAAPFAVEHLAALGEEVKTHLGRFREPARRAIWEASQRGYALVDLCVDVDAGAFAVLGACQRLLLDAARAARAGHLLTEPPGREVYAWLRWVRQEMAGQAAGRAPRPCPFPVDRQ